MPKISQLPDGGQLQTTDRVAVARAGVTYKATVGGRESLGANRTYYVRADGSDSNDGLTNSAGGAFLTIPKAITEFLKLDTSIYNVTIKVGSGTYTAPINISDWVGSGELSVEGDTTTPSNVVISTTSASAIMVNATLTKKLTIKGFRLQTTTSGNCLIIAQPAQVEMSDVEFHTCAGHHIVLSGPCNLTAVGNYAITGSPALSHVELSIGAKFTCESKTVTLTGTPNWPLAFCYAWRLGIGLFSGTTYSGAATGQRYSAITNAVIDTGGGGANHLPGDVAGTTATGGQYV